MERIREKAGKEGKKMSPVSLSEPCLLVWEQIGFSRGSNVAIEHPRQLYIIDIVTLAAEERLLPRIEKQIFRPIIRTAADTSGG